jgi:hypothetical protein
MRSKTLLAAAALSAVALTALVVAGLGHAQSQQPAPPAHAILPAGPQGVFPSTQQAGPATIPAMTQYPMTQYPAPVVPIVPAAHAPTPPAPAQSWEVVIEGQSIDQLLDGLDALRTQRAELERKEKALAGVLKKKVEKQKERLDKSGVMGPPAEAGLPQVSVPSAPAGEPFSLEKLNQ